MVIAFVRSGPTLRTETRAYKSLFRWCKNTMRGNGDVTPELSMKGGQPAHGRSEPHRTQYGFDYGFSRGDAEGSEISAFGAERYSEYSIPVDVGMNRGHRTDQTVLRDMRQL